jgi:heme oxygenase (biliverdin-IX-beta and delta-forming)
MTDDVLRRLRTATSADHDRVERALDLTAPQLDRAGLVSAMTTLHAFWRAAEAGLDDWARDRPADARRLDWAARRRTALFAADIKALGADPDPAEPALPAVRDTDRALGRLYVLEGATLGGAVIHRHLASLPSLRAVRLRAFSPYGQRTGVMWAAYRRATREHVAAGGDADRVVRSAQETFAVLAAAVVGRAPAGSPG